MHAAHICLRLEPKLEYDPTREVFVGDPEGLPAVPHKAMSTPLEAPPSS